MSDKSWMTPAEYRAAQARKAAQWIFSAQAAFAIVAISMLIGLGFGLGVELIVLILSIFW